MCYKYRLLRCRLALRATFGKKVMHTLGKKNAQFARVRMEILRLGKHRGQGQEQPALAQARLISVGNFPRRVFHQFSLIRWRWDKARSLPALSRDGAGGGNLQVSARFELQLGHPHFPPVGMISSRPHAAVPPPRAVRCTVETLRLPESLGPKVTMVLEACSASDPLVRVRHSPKASEFHT